MEYNDIDKSFPSKLNAKIREYFEKIENELNRKSIPFGDIQPGNLQHCWQIQSYGDVFKVPTDCDGFNLRPPSCGQIKDVLIQHKDKNTFVVRRVIGYTLAYRISEAKDLKEIEKLMGPVMYEATLSLENAIGFSPNVPHHGFYGTFKRPGMATEYFRDLADSAGYEFRLYSSTFPAINLKAE